MNVYCENPGCSSEVSYKQTCEHCKIPRYCSEGCRSEAWEKQHHFECESTGLSISDFQSAQEMVGKGSYGQVRLLRRKASKKAYACKQISKTFIRVNSSVDLILNEIKVQKSLNHPNIVKLISYFEDKRNIYMILEYASKGSLFKLIRSVQFLPEDQAWRFFLQSCIGIKYLHNRNIIHRDIKPENILIDEHDRVKICDFGWCVQSEEPRNTVCGTVDYMAPEILDQGGYSFQVDSWALGILLYEMIHGRPPFQALREEEKRKKISEGVLEFRDDISEQVKDLIRKLLVKEINERYTVEDCLKHEWVVRELPFLPFEIGQKVRHETMGEGQIVRIEGLLCIIEFEQGEFSIPVNDVAWEVELLEEIVIQQLKKTDSRASLGDKQVPLNVPITPAPSNEPRRNSFQKRRKSVPVGPKKGNSLVGKKTKEIDTSDKAMNERLRELEMLSQNIEGRHRIISERSTNSKQSWFANFFGCGRR